MKDKTIRWTSFLLNTTNHAGEWVGLLGLRLLLGWEFFESGLEKAMGENWFADIMDRFPFPFNVIPSDISWQTSTWSELIGGVALVVGFATRFFGISLTVLTVVAIVSVHWPEHWSSWMDLIMGYTITDNGYGNFKLPVLYLGMLLPLILSGPGKLSLDALIARWVLKDANGRR